MVMKVKFNTVLNNEVVNIEARTQNYPDCFVVKYLFNDIVIYTLEEKEVNLADMEQPELRDYLRRKFC